MRTTLSRTLVALVPAAVLTGLLATPVAAHVTVSSPDAAPGGYGKLVFRVPNESDTAATTKVRVTLPAETPFASVSTKPHPGWNVRVQEITLPQPVEVDDLTLTEAARTVTWTARGGGIDVGMFDEFELSVGPISEDARTLTFPTVQTYADGEVARWVQPTPEGGSEPEHPAPVLDLTALDTGSESSNHTEDDPDTEVTAAQSDGASAVGEEASSDTTARALAAGGLVLGAVALGSSLLRRRREGGD